MDDAKDPHQLIVYRYFGYVTQPHLGKTEYWRGKLDDLIVVVWKLYRDLELWDDWRAMRPDMFMTHPLIDRSVTVIEQFVVSRVMR